MWRIKESNIKKETSLMSGMKEVKYERAKGSNVRDKGPNVRYQRSIYNVRNQISKM